VFGRPPRGTACLDRPAAYAVVFDGLGRVAVVRWKDRWFLPGGGGLPDEAPEATVLREIREECGRPARILRPLGEAVQYFRDESCWYRMRAKFFRAELEESPTGPAEHELAWLDPRDDLGFFHRSHLWAVARALRGRRREGPRCRRAPESSAGG
jgi:8-oxo-dGTP pyrophosphatase MutT (NUDIX family)